MRAIRVFALGAMTLLGVASCGGAETCKDAKDARCESAPVRARGTFMPKAGGSLSGTVELVQRGGVVTLIADLKGAPPGPHGVHIHETGDCSAPDFSSAGGHFNPTGAPHACPPTVPRHAGDLGNTVIDADGKGHVQIETDLFTLTPGERSVVGRALILHHDADDCAGQPTGHSGDRIACAVIRLE